MEFCDLFSQEAFEPVPVVVTGPPFFDEYEDATEVAEEVVACDVGPVLRYTFLSPRAPDQVEWSRNNVF